MPKANMKLARNGHPPTVISSKKNTVNTHHPFKHGFHWANTVGVDLSHRSVPGQRVWARLAVSNELILTLQAGEHKATQQWEGRHDRKHFSLFVVENSLSHFTGTNRAMGEVNGRGAKQRKRAKYWELVEDCCRNGWKARCVPLEVGCRGFASNALSKAYATLGNTYLRRRTAINNNGDAAEKVSRWLWLWLRRWGQ